MIEVTAGMLTSPPLIAWTIMPEYSSVRVVSPLSTIPLPLPVACQ